MSEPASTDAWMRRGSCRRYRDEPDFFVRPDQVVAAAHIRVMCGGCVVSIECLAYAMRHPDQTSDAVYGGTTPFQRRFLAQRERHTRCDACSRIGRIVDRDGDRCDECGLQWIA